MSLSRSTLQRLVGTGLALAGLVVLANRRPIEPFFDGAPLSFWLSQMDVAPVQRRPETTEALVALGDAALPGVRRRLTARDGVARRLLLRLSTACPSLPLHVTSSESARTSAAEVAAHLLREGHSCLAEDLTVALRLVHESAAEEAVRRALLAAGPSAMSAVTVLVRDHSVKVQLRGLDLLGVFLRAHGPPRHGAPDLAAVLGSQLATPSPEVVLAATEILAWLSNEAEAVVPLLMPGLEHSDSRVRAATATTLASVAPREAECVPALVVLLADPVDAVRCAAATALGRFGASATAAVTDLARAVGEGSTPLAVAAANALGHIGSGAGAAVPALAANLHRSQPVLRASCATALGRIGAPPDAGPPVLALAEALRDPDEYVRRNAARALRAYGRRAGAAMPGLIGALRDPAESVRVHAVEALGSLGAVARPAIPFLEAARNNNQSVMNPPVLAALALIAGPGLEEDRR